MQDFKEHDQKEYRFKLLSEAAFEGICIHDHGIIIDANQQFCDMFGYTLKELKGMDAFYLIAPQSRQMVKDYISSGFSGEYESYQIRKDGSIFPVEIRARQIQKDGDILRFAVFRDLTKRKEMERQLAESEKKYRQLYEFSPIALYRTQISDGKVLECNQALAELFGYDSKEVFIAKENVLTTYINIGDRKRLLDELKQKKKIKGFKLKVKKKDGQQAWIEITAEIFPECGYIEGAMLDITVTKVLTKAEMKVFRLVVKGKCNKEIAKSLKRSVRTIEDHRSHIMKKLNMDNLPDLVRKAESLHLESYVKQ